MAATVFSTFMPPIGFAIMVLNPNQPINRFIQYIFGFNPRNHSVSMIIVMIFSAHATLKASTIAGFLLNTAMMYMQFETFWISVITPVQRLIRGRREITLLSRNSNALRTRDGKIFFQFTELGVLSQSVIFWTFKCHQIVNTGINEVYKYVSFHHGTVLLLWCMSAFAFIRYIGRVKLLISWVLLGAWVVSNWIVLFEVYFVAGVSTIGKKFLRHVNMSQIKGTRDSKVAKSLWNLHLKTSSPFFKMGNASFLEFLKIATDITVTLLIDIHLHEIPWIGFQFNSII